MKRGDLLDPLSHLGLSEQAARHHSKGTGAQSEDDWRQAEIEDSGQGEHVGSSAGDESRDTTRPVCQFPPQAGDGRHEKSGAQQADAGGVITRGNCCWKLEASRIGVFR